ncbi:hypothetical protein C0995_004121 [Termitomyces sp. Mi166|nr:hypothetical protein C0995_004121 [Termitomyces sp. Mi166\
MAAFLQDDLAVMVVEGLLDQIKLMRRQRMTALEQIERVGKCKAPAFEKPIMEPKQARALSQRPQELAWAPAHTVAWLPKVWEPLNVERLNSCFTGALSDLHNNTIFVGADANWAAAFKYSSCQQAKMPALLVYKFAPRGFPRTPYELEWLYKHYANEHAPHHD